MHTFVRQRGLSMIELMVALAISSFLILGVTQIYIDNRQSYTFQQSQSENQEGSRYAMLFFQQELGKAGYRRNPSENPINAFPAQNLSGCNFVAGETIKRISASSVCIRYQPRDGSDRDCQGNAVASPNDYVAPYTKATENFVERIWLNTTTNELTCTRQTGSTSTAKDSVLATGIADLRFVFGLGSPASPRDVVKYVTTAPGSNEPILTVRYITLMRSTNSGVRDASTVDTALQNWIDLTGATAAEVTAMKGADNKQIYQVSQGTVMLRNLMP